METGLMNMAVMRVGEVGVAVLQRVVPVRMLVLDAWLDGGRVRMAVVLVVNVRMVVRHHFVLMRMRVTLAQMQPEPDRHQCAGDQQTGRQRLAQDQGQDRPDKRRRREIRAGSGRTEMA